MQKWTKSEPEIVEVAFLLCDRFSNLCLANALEPLRAANALGSERVFRWQVLTPEGAPVRSSSEIAVVPHGGLSDLSSCDYLFVLLSYDLDRHNTRALQSALRKAARKARVVIGFDAAPWLLAAAGLLQGRRATIHWDMLGAFMEQFPGIGVERARVLRDGNRWTCAGAMSALDLVLDMVGEHAGLAVRLDVEAMFLHPGRTEPQGGARVSDPLVHRALALMRAGIAHPLKLTDLAQQISCQPRTLDRHFRRVLGASPGEVYRHLRLSAARQMVETTTRSVADIAAQTGYDSPVALTRAFRRSYGMTPRDLRRATKRETRPADYLGARQEPSASVPL